MDLCSGIGGFALGLQSTGCFKTIGFCEIDPFCQKVLKKNFPGVPIYNDIKEFKPNDEGLRPDIITSGFPCQPFSVAGKRKSEKDDRNLWKETLRVIQESRPAWFIGENVGGIVKLYLDTILEDLESANYSTR
ncbi:MAG: DNA (cytosine-5-)-methyltransferase, partial [SAR324 cluster bacterium]|nr:DNA (cytosine-5-)-methyltransferase [SAR324 cluster bacterium]